MKKELSIIIVNCNTKNLLKNCLNSIIENTKGLDYEIIVVDNASQDESVEMVKNDFSAVRIIVNNDNLGFAKANNQGIRCAKGENVLLLNSDTIIVGDCLNKTFKFSRDVVDAGVIGCKVLNEDKTIQYTCYHRPGFLTELIFFTKTIIKDFWDPVAYYKFFKYWNHQKIRSVDCISGCFLWVKSEVFNKVGLLDENFFMYYEDSEFCLRVKTLSLLKNYYYPESRIIHLKGKSNENVNYNTLKYCYKSVKYYLNKCYSKKTERRFNFLCNLIWNLEIFIFSMLKFNKQFNKKVLMLKQLCKV